MFKIIAAGFVTLCYYFRLIWKKIRRSGRDTALLCPFAARDSSFRATLPFIVVQDGLVPERTTVILVNYY